MPKLGRRTLNAKLFVLNHFPIKSQTTEVAKIGSFHLNFQCILCVINHWCRLYWGIQLIFALFQCPTIYFLKTAGGNFSTIWAELSNESFSGAAFSTWAIDREQWDQLCHFFAECVLCFSLFVSSQKVSILSVYCFCIKQCSFENIFVTHKPYLFIWYLWCIKLLFRKGAEECGADIVEIKLDPNTNKTGNIWHILVEVSTLFL